MQSKRLYTTRLSWRSQALGCYISESPVIMLLLYYPSVKENVLLCFLPRLLLFKSTDAQTETPRQHLCLEQLELNVLLITASERKKATDLCGAPFSKWWWNRKKVLFLNNHACCFLDLSTWLAYMSCLVLCLLPQLSTFPSILSLN